MAPAACDTIWQNLQDFGRSPEDYSRIFTCGYCIENRDADFGTGISYWKELVMEKKIIGSGEYFARKRNILLVFFEKEKGVGIHEISKRGAEYSI